MANYYEILQIPRNATINEVKAAFRRLARQYHPDVNPDDPSAVDKFREIERAYEVLRDPIQRQHYDYSIIPETPTVNQSDRFFLNQGRQYTKAKNYQLAIDHYSRAIEINSQLWEAYLKRAEAYYYNYEDRSVLADCRCVFQLNPNCSEAYYYLGLSRQRLGYTQSAIEAFNRAINLDPDSPQTYYQRGLALAELSNYLSARRDLQVAAEYFQKAGDLSRYHSLQKQLESLQKKGFQHQQKNAIQLMKTFPNDAITLIKVLRLSLASPRNGITSAFLKLERGQVFRIGILSAVIGSFFLSISWKNWLVNLPFIPLFSLGLVPFFVLSLSSYGIRKISHSYGYFSADIFLSGLVLLPLYLVLFISSSLKIYGDISGGIIGIIGIYSAWILYNGYLQLSNLSAKIALLFAPFMLFLISFIIWGVYYYL